MARINGVEYKELAEDVRKFLDNLKVKNKEKREATLKSMGVEMIRAENQGHFFDVEELF